MTIACRLGALILSAMLAAPAVAAPPLPPGFSPTGQPLGFDVTGKTYVVDGYRGAKWGMTSAQARQAVARDFPDAKVGIDVADPVTHATMFVVIVPHLAPGPGPMAITYMFGASTGKLFHINLDWQAEKATAADQAALTAAGSRMVENFLGYYWKLLSVARGIPAGPNALILFAGAGESGGNVEVLLQGVGYTMKTTKGETIAMPPPAAPTQALLHVALSQSEMPADVYAIKPGEF
jgi:hypothetical protein